MAGFRFKSAKSGRGRTVALSARLTDPEKPSFCASP